MKGKILFLSQANPLGIGGGSYATHAYLRAFADIFDGKIDVVMADSWDEPWDDNITISNKYIAPPMNILQYTFSLFTLEIQRYSGTAERILKEKPEEYSFIVSNGSGISGRLHQLAHQIGVKLVTIHHNYEPEYFSDNSKGLHRLLYIPIIRKLERTAYMRSDLNLFLTNQDKLKFLQEYGENNRKNEVIGVFEFSDYHKPKIVDPSNKKLTFVITGSLCTMQGIDGIRFFFKDLYQYLPKECNVIVAGRNPKDEVKSLCEAHKNVQLIPDPANMSEVISSGDIYICPTRVGGGIKLRVMDGLRLGLPVITHACSARGYDVFFDTPYLKSFTSKDEFKNAIEDIVSHIRSYSKTDVIQKYKKCFSYKEGMARMKIIFESIC